MFTSAGRRGYLLQYFREALNGGGTIHAVNSQPIVPVAYYADNFEISPPIYSEEYIPFLLNYCQKYEIGLIIPLFDPDLPVLAANSKLFQSQGVKLLVSSEAVIRICNDKWQTHNWLLGLGMPVPQTYLDLADFETALRNQSIDFPVMIKPRFGTGSLSIYRADNLSEAYIFIERIKREIDRSYLRFESSAFIEAPFIIQECVSGDEFGLDVINNLVGEQVCTVVKKKILMRAGETDIAQIVKYPALSAMGETIGNNLKHIGNLDMDVIRDASGNVFILDLNARFGGGYPFTHLAGANLVQAIVSWCTGKEADLLPNVGVTGMKDIGIIRYV